MSEGLNQQGLKRVCENYAHSKNEVIPSRFSGEGPRALPWSFVELRNARSLGKSPRDDDLQFWGVRFAQHKRLGWDSFLVMNANHNYLRVSLYD